MTVAFPVAAAPRGTQTTFTVTALNAAVAPDQPSAFEVFISNDGQSVWTQAIFTGLASAGTVLSAIATQGSVAACTPSAATVSCVLPTLESDESVTLLIQILAPGAGGTIALDGTLTIDAGGGNPNSASKDTFKDSDALDVVDSPDFFGRWQSAHAAGQTFATDPVGGTNGQSTSVFVPAFAAGYAAFLQESDDALLCNGAGVAGFGKTVEMHFANGLSPVTVTLTYNRVTAGNKTPATTTFVHQLDNGQCEFPPRDCEENPGFCFDAFWQGSGPNRLLIIQAELGSNGRGRGV
jgi:hypothetical protein